MIAKQNQRLERLVTKSWHLRNEVEKLHEWEIAHVPPEDLDEFQALFRQRETKSSQKQLSTRQTKKALVKPKEPLQLRGNQLTTRLGGGGQADVYRHPENDRLVIKVFHCSEPTDKDRQRFQREFDILKGLHDEAFVEVHEYGDDLIDANGLRFLYFTMDYERAQTLDDCDELPLSEIASVCARIADLLAALHKQKIIHNDIKPSNILYQPGSLKPKIIDFGIAWIPTGKANTAPAGTLIYHDPSCSRSDPRQDIHALGVTLSVLIGKSARPGQDEVMRARLMSISKICRARPWRRYLSAEKVAEDLERVAEGHEPLLAIPEALRKLKSAYRALAASRLLLSSALLNMVLFCTVVFIYLINARESRHSDEITAEMETLLQTGLTADGLDKLQADLRRSGKNYVDSPPNDLNRVAGMDEPTLIRLLDLRFTIAKSYAMANQTKEAKDAFVVIMKILETRPTGNSKLAVLHAKSQHELAELEHFRTANSETAKDSYVNAIKLWYAMLGKPWPSEIQTAGSGDKITILIENIQKLPVEDLIPEHYQAIAGIARECGYLGDLCRDHIHNGMSDASACYNASQFIREKLDRHFCGEKCDHWPPTFQDGFDGWFQAQRARHEWLRSRQNTLPAENAVADLKALITDRKQLTDAMESLLSDQPKDQDSHAHLSELNRLHLESRDDLLSLLVRHKNQEGMPMGLIGNLIKQQKPDWGEVSDYLKMAEQYIGTRWESDSSLGLSHILCKRWQLRLDWYRSDDDSRDAKDYRTDIEELIQDLHVRFRTPVILINNEELVAIQDLELSNGLSASVCVVWAILESDLATTPSMATASGPVVKKMRMEISRKLEQRKNKPKSFEKWTAKE